VNALLPVAVVIAYVILLTFVAIRARAAREFEEFSLAKRALPLALVFGSLAATYIGPGYSIGFVGRGFRSGFLFLIIGLAYALQNILVGLLIAPRLRALKNCHTLGEAVGQKYNRTCQILAGIISVSLCAGFSAVMAKAGGDVLHNLFRLPHWSSVFIVVAVTALYTTFGGLRASVITDAFQFTSFATLLPITLLLVLIFHLKGGPAAFSGQALAATRDGFQGTPFIEIVGLLAAFLLGETLIPPYANRALASKTTKISRNGFILAGIFSTVWFLVMISLGITARNILPKDTVEDLVLLNLVKYIMPASGYSLLLVVLISVVMSSLDSLLNAGAVSFTQDIFKPFVKLHETSSLNVGRVATIIIAVIAAAGAVIVPNIIGGLLICYTLWAPAILPTLIIGLWIKHPRPLAGTLSMGVGLAIMLWIILWEILEILKSVNPWYLEHSTLKYLKYMHPQNIEITQIAPLIIIPAIGATLLAYALGYWIERHKTGV
jgi:SSS family solute:Na+ symporter